MLRPKLQSEKKKADNEKKQGRRMDQVWKWAIQYNVLPNHLLFAEGLTPAVTAEVLTALFIPYPGLL